MNAPIVLASESPRRRALLAQIGVRFDHVACAIDEAPEPTEGALLYVERVARTKAEYARRVHRTQKPVLAADTVVVLDGETLGKPRDPAHADALLQRLSARSHDVLTAVALASSETSVRLSRSRVWFRSISAHERAAYCATGEPMDKAGGYAIQGMGAIFVTRLEGSYSGVMGLPLLETCELLRSIGIDPLAAAGATP